MEKQQVDNSTRLETLICKALELYETKALFQWLEDPFGIVRRKAGEELARRGEQPPSTDGSPNSKPPREMDLTLDEDDLYYAGSGLSTLIFQALKLLEADALYPLLEDAAVIVRWLAISALRTRGETETFNRASAMCKDPRADIREIGAQILSQLGPADALEPLRKRSVPLLLELLKDPSPDVRAAAAVGFGHIDAFDKAREALMDAAKDSDAEVRRCVAFALACDKHFEDENFV